MYRKHIEPQYKCDNCQDLKNKDELCFIKQTLEWVCCEDCRQGSLNAKKSSHLFNLINKWACFDNYVFVKYKE